MLVKASVAAALLLQVATAQQTLYGQCAGGSSYTGPTECASGGICSTLNPYYGQCVPGTAAPAPATSTANEAQTTMKTTKKKKTTTTTKKKKTTTTTKKKKTTTTTTTTTKSKAAPSPTAISCTSNSPPSSAGNVQYGGVNLAGFDFGCGTDGTCTGKIYAPPSSQIQHFKQDGFNTFRIPIGWQSLTPTLGGSLGGLFSQYDSYVQQCLSSGAHCIIDIHNYARWNGAIIGQGGPTDDQFVSVWTQLAQHYANQPNIIFGVMNEPHEVNIQTWAATVQKVVTAIRNAGAKNQLILLPGNNYTSAGAFISNGSADALGKVTNPDGSFTGLIFDVHKYLDSDNSGTHTECVTDNISDAFQPLATYLRCHGRQAILSETGGGNTQSCVQYLNTQLQFLNKNSDVYLGYIGWGAGGFGSTYELNESPNADGSDQLLVKQVLIPNFHPNG